MRQFRCSSLGKITVGMSLTPLGLTDIQAKELAELIEKGSKLGSAAYAIAAPSTGIYSEDKMNIVGSAGTMIQLKGKPHGNVDQDGEKTITLYASKSISKNKNNYLPLHSNLRVWWNW